LLVTSLLGVSTTVTVQAQEWSPTGASLNSVFMVDANDGWAVGTGVWQGTGSAIIHWDGTSWNNVTSPTNVDLNSVFMVDANDGWAASSQGVLIHWNGTSWELYSTNAGQNFNSLFMVDANDGWGVGSDIGHWNGTGWDDVANPVDYLYSVSMVDANDGWAVGRDGAIIHWDGTDWNNVTSPVEYDLEEVFMVDANDGWAVGYAGIIHWDGTTWNNVTVPEPAFSLYGGYMFNAISMASANDGWAVGGTYGIFGGEAHRYHWDGTSWTESNSGDGGLLNSVSMVDSNDAWAVGRYGTVLRLVGDDTWIIPELPDGILMAFSTVVVLSVAVTLRKLMQKPKVNIKLK
jgi:hypothetical protein